MAASQDRSGRVRFLWRDRQLPCPGLDWSRSERSEFHPTMTNCNPAAVAQRWTYPPSFMDRSVSKFASPRLPTYSSMEQLSIAMAEPQPQ